MNAVKNIKLNSFEDLFGSDKSSTIEINITDLQDFQNHPFKVLDDDDMKKLIESIKQNGVITPIIVRPIEDNKYEIIAGHRRTYASKVIGLKTIPATIKENISDEDATVYMVDSNISREVLLPSEKAFSYKMKQDALKHQGKVGHNTNNSIGEDFGDSGRQVQRYIRLTNLIPELLEFVDINKIKLVPAVELSYIVKEQQKIISEYINQYNKFPGINEAKELRKLSEKNNLTYSNIQILFNNKKNHSKTSIKLSDDIIKQIEIALPNKNLEEAIKEIISSFLNN